MLVNADCLKGGSRHTYRLIPCVKPFVMGQSPSFQVEEGLSPLTQSCCMN
jgi:hypothetical protein